MQEKSVFKFCRSAFLSWCQDFFATDGPSIYLAFAAHQIFIALTGAKHQYNTRLVLLIAKIKFLRSSRTQMKSDTTSYFPLAHLHLRSSACTAIFLALCQENSYKPSATNAHSTECCCEGRMNKFIVHREFTVYNSNFLSAAGRRVAHGADARKLKAIRKLSLFIPSSWTIENTLCWRNKFNRHGRAVNILGPKMQILRRVPKQMQVRQKPVGNGGLWAKFWVGVHPLLWASLLLFVLGLCSYTAAPKRSVAAILVVYFICFYTTSCYWEISAIASRFAKKNVIIVVIFVVRDWPRSWVIIVEANWAFIIAVIVFAAG